MTCVMRLQDIRVGNNAMAILNGPVETNVETGCSSPNSCDPSPCGPGTCVDMWGDHLCHCPPGESPAVAVVVVVVLVDMWGDHLCHCSLVSHRLLWLFWWIYGVTTSVIALLVHHWLLDTFLFNVLSKSNIQVTCRFMEH